MTALQKQVLYWAAVAALVASVLAFAIGLRGDAPVRVWEGFLVNLLFFLGIAQGGVVLSAALYLTHARWGGPGIYRLAEAFAGFLPLGFVLFWVLFAGRETVFPWVLHPLPKKAAWLNVPFLFMRDGLGLLAMTLLSFRFISASRSPEVVKWAESYGLIDYPPPIIRRYAPAVIIGFAIVYSLIAFDLVMSLSPRWYSTLFGVYFFAGAFWSALALIALLAIFLRRPIKAGESATHDTLLHDAGKLVFAFSVFWVYLMWSQYLPIWYADIPRETFFVVIRTYRMPWQPLAFTVLALVWVIPFTFLMGRRPKMTPAILGPVCVLGLVGMWLERYVLVTPSLSGQTIPLGWIELFLTAGFIALFGICTGYGLRLVPPLASPPEAVE